MKTLQLVSFFLIAFLFCSNTVIAQEEDEEIIENFDQEDQILYFSGVFQGIEDGSFVFSILDSDDEESTISFDKIAPYAQKEFNFSSKEMIGKSFEISYSEENQDEENDDSDFDFTSIKTILTIKLL